MRKAVRPHSVAGITLIEAVITLAVIGILVTIGIPFAKCHWEKLHLAEIMTDMRVARDRVEVFEMESGHFPASLEQAFHPMSAPTTLCYCSDDPPDPNKGHGNEWCLFFDPDNPSGNAPPQSAPGMKYLLATKRGLAPNCANLDWAFLGCCGSEPRMIKTGEVMKTPGHPGHGIRDCVDGGRGNGGGGGGGNGGGGNGGGKGGGKG